MRRSSSFCGGPKYCDRGYYFDAKSNRLIDLYYVIYRRLQLPLCWPYIQTPILVLSHHHLCAWMYAGYCIMGQLLAWPARCSGKGGFGRDDIAHHVDSNGINQFSIASSGIHKSHWCLAGRLPVIHSFKKKSLPWRIFDEIASYTTFDFLNPIFEKNTTAL